MLIVFLALLFFFFIGILAYKFYIIPRINYKKVISEVSGIPNAESAQTNVFGNILDEKKFLDEFNLVRNYAESSPMMLALSVSGTLVHGSARPCSADYERILPVGATAVSVEKASAVTNYKIIYTKNRYFSGKELLDLPILVDAGHLIVLDSKKGILSYMWEMPKFYFPESLVDGNVVIFICDKADCSNRKIAWALVF